MRPAGFEPMVFIMNYMDTRAMTQMMDLLETDHRVALELLELRLDRKVDPRSWLARSAGPAS